MTAIADPFADPFAPPSAPGPLGEPEPRPVSVPDQDESAVALGLAAAFLVARGLASAWLSRQEPDLSGTLSRQAWDTTGAFAPAAVGPLTRGYTAGGLSSEQATRAATAYAASLGEHLAETSGQAMIDGFNAQLAARWPVRTAWARAAAGYGLDGPTMLAWIRQLMSSERLPSVSRVEDLLMARAMLMGRTEAFRARNSGLALGWVWMQQNGLLGEQTAKMWRTARDELTCPFCLSLDGQTVGLSEPFRYPDGTEIFCPPSHPNCRCVPELAGLAAPTLERELELVGKAWGPEEAAKHPHKGPGQGRGQFARVGAERPEPEVQAPPEPATRPAGFPTRTSAFAGTQASAFTQAQASAFTRAQGSAFAQAARTQAEPQTQAQGSAFARTSAFARPARAQVVPQTLHRVLLIIPPKPGRRDLPDRPPQWSITRAELESDGGGGKVPLDGLLPPSGGHVVDFDKITAYAKLNPAEQESIGIDPLFEQIPAETLDRHYRRRPRARLNPSTFSPSEMLMERPRPGEDRFWTNPRHDTTNARLDAYMLADAITYRGTERPGPLPMSEGALNDIFLNSGWDYHRAHGEQQPGRPYISSRAMTPEQQAAAIVEATKRPDTAAQVALSQAYMDQVVYTLPYITVPKSAKHLRSLQQDMLHFVGDGPIDYGRFSDVPTQDIYVFADGFNPPSSIPLGGHNDVRGEYRPLAGRYQVDDIIYESDHSVPGIAAVRWIYLKPLGN